MLGFGFFRIGAAAQGNHCGKKQREKGVVVKVTAALAIHSVFDSIVRCHIPKGSLFHLSPCLASFGGQLPGDAPKRETFLKYRQSRTLSAIVAKCPPRLFVRSLFSLAQTLAEQTTQWPPDHWPFR